MAALKADHLLSDNWCSGYSSIDRQAESTIFATEPEVLHEAGYDEQAILDLRTVGAIKRVLLFRQRWLEQMREYANEKTG